MFLTPDSCGHYQDTARALNTKHPVVKSWNNRICVTGVQKRHTCVDMRILLSDREGCSSSEHTTVAGDHFPLNFLVHQQVVKQVAVPSEKEEIPEWEDI